MEIGDWTMNEDKWEIDVLKGLALFGGALLGIAGGAAMLALVFAIIAKLLGVS